MKPAQHVPIVPVGLSKPERMPAACINNNPSTYHPSDGMDMQRPPTSRLGSAGVYPQIFPQTLELVYHGERPIQHSETGLSVPHESARLAVIAMATTRRGVLSMPLEGILRLGGRPAPSTDGAVGSYSRPSH